MKNKFKNFLKLKKDKKKVFIWFIISIFLFESGITLGKYAYKEVKNYYLETKGFYFNSDKLSEEGTLIEMTNWSGVGEYPVKFNMSSYENSKLYSNDDIYYDIDYKCSDNVVCSIKEDKKESVISSDSNQDSFTIVIAIPTDVKLKEKDVVELNVYAKSTSPYKKELKGTFRLVVGYYGLSYEIDDYIGSPYLETRITNTYDYYVVREEFDNYSIEDKIDIPTYQNLSEDNKQKCASAIIKLDFDPSEVLLDLTSEDYLNALHVSKKVLNGYEYVNSITIKLDALSSEQIKFYKVNTEVDNTYPNINNQSIISVSYDE